jgi:tetratricopeptide (TPR) repeat protein
VLFLLVGLMGGFLAGYISHEVMDDVQPARIAAGSALPAAAPAPGAAPQAAAAAASPMEEINRLQQAIASNPEDADSILRLANLSFDIQRWERAAELYERYLALRPGDPDVLTDLGITLRARGEFDRALELFREAQAKAPDHWQSRFNEVIVLAFDQRQLDAAEKALAVLAEKLPGSPDVTRLGDEIRRLREANG